MQVVLCLIAIILDRIIGDPKWLPHPVIWIGRLISLLDKAFNKGRMRKFKGGVSALFVVGLVGASMLSLTIFTYSVHWALGMAFEVVMITIGLAQKSLAEAARAVSKPLIARDLVEARKKLGWIVGRDTEKLGEAEIVRGVVETVSENTSDGVTAPLFYALLFGATGAWIYKAINTLDSMIAYKDEQYADFGYLAAKMDDVANFVPSRITGLMILVYMKTESTLSFKERFKSWKVDAKKHPSPNSGYLEAATAYQLGIQLGGVNYYKGQKSVRALMGKPLVKMTAVHIEKAVQHMYRVTLLFFFIVGGMIFVLTGPWG